MASPTDLQLQASVFLLSSFFAVVVVVICLFCLGSNDHISARGWSCHGNKQTMLVHLLVVR